MSIRTKISIIYSLLFSFIIAISGILYLHYFIETNRNTIIRSVMDYAEIATPGVIRSYELYKGTSPLLLYREIYSILEYSPYLNYIEIISPEGVVLFNSKEARMGIFKKKKIDMKLLPYIKKLSPKSFLDENYIVHVFIPFMDELGSHIYTVHYVNSLRAPLEHITRTVIGIIIVIIVAILFSVLISTFVARNITAKIDRLKHAALSFERGNLNVNFEIHSNDEIGELALVFENMRKTIKSNIAKLQQTLVQLQELDRVKNEFIANISHELKTPLTAAIGYISLIKGGKIGKPSDEILGALKIVEKNLNELSLKIDSILQISKLQMYKEHIEKQKVHIAKIIKKCVENYRPTLEVKNIEIEVDIEDENIYLIGYEKGLESMICNLIDNAVKFTDRGKVSVRLSMGKNKEYVVLEIKDTGIGIPKEKLKKIYDKFYQVESSSVRRFGGIGLGLSIVKEVVDLHNGIIKVKSTEGKGTMFRVLLPIKGEQNDKENLNN